MADEYPLLDKLTELGKPYTLKRSRPWLPWWLADAFSSFDVCYDGQVIRTLSDSYSNARDLVALLNVVYQVGAADALSLAARG